MLEWEPVFHSLTSRLKFDSKIALAAPKQCYKKLYTNSSGVHILRYIQNMFRIKSWNMLSYIETFGKRNMKPYT